MVPCPWFTEVADFAKSHPGMDLGLHLTLTSEWKTYRWGPVAPRDRVASLLDPNGYFYLDNGPVAAHARPEEAEVEVRSQIKRALAMGIRPTHLDIHMGTLAATPQLYSVLIKVAHEYRLPFMAVKLPGPAGRRDAETGNAERHCSRSFGYVHPPDPCRPLDGKLCEGHRVS